MPAPNVARDTLRTTCADPSSLTNTVFVFATSPADTPVGETKVTLPGSVQKPNFPSCPAVEPIAHW
jgi:hypothetical protein